jgi:hypothetical protein
MRFAESNEAFEVQNKPQKLDEVFLRLETSHRNLMKSFEVRNKSQKLDEVF